MIGRRMSAAAIVVAAVTVGGVTGAVIGIPGLSGASSTSTSSPAKSSDTPNGAPEIGHHFRGFAGSMGAGQGVLDAAAKALNLSTQDLLTKLSDGKTTIADIAKQENIDLKTVTDAMQAVANDDISKMVNNPFPAPPDFGGKGPMGGAFKGGPGFGFGRLGGSLDTISKALKLSTQDLLTKLSDGKTSIADIAKQQSVDVNSIIDTLVNDAKSRTDQAVKDGHLTQNQATKIESTLKDEITKMVNNAGPVGWRHFGGFGRHGGHLGFGGFPGMGGQSPTGPAALPPAPAI